MFTSVLPNQITLALVSTAAFNGAIDKNPYNLQTFDVKNISLNINGEQIPSHGLNPDFEGNKFTKLFRSFHDNIGKLTSDSGNIINRTFMKSGAFLASWDLSPDLCVGWHNHSPSTGNIDLELTFSKPLAESVTIIAFASYSSLIEVDADKRVQILFPQLD